MTSVPATPQFLTGTCIDMAFSASRCLGRGACRARGARPEARRGAGGGRNRQLAHDWWRRRRDAMLSAVRNPGTWEFCAVSVTREINESPVDPQPEFVAVYIRDRASCACFRPHHPASSRAIDSQNGVDRLAAHGAAIAALEAAHARDGMAARHDRGIGLVVHADRTLHRLRGTFAGRGIEGTSLQTPRGAQGERLGRGMALASTISTSEVAACEGCSCATG